MNVNQLTGSDFFKARTDIGLSLLSASKLTGINRNGLSKFEQEKGTLSIGDKKDLVKFYEERGYDFNTPSHINLDDVSERYAESHQDSQQKIKDNLPDDVADTLAAFVDNHHDMVTALQQKQEAKPISKDHDKLNAEVINHFKRSKNGELTRKVGGGWMSKEKGEYSSKLIALLALQYLRELESLQPDIFTTSLKQAQADKNEDLVYVLEGLTECLDYEDGPDEFTEQTSKIIA